MLSMSVDQSLLTMTAVPLPLFPPFHSSVTTASPSSSSSIPLSPDPALLWNVDFGATGGDLHYYGPRCADHITFSDCAKNTDSPFVFSSLRRNPVYHIPIPNGVYDVTILAIEDEYPLPGRSFDVQLEGNVRSDPPQLSAFEVVVLKSPDLT